MEKTKSFLSSLGIGLVVLLAAIILTGCGHREKLEGRLNPEALQQVAFYETYQLVDLIDPLLRMEEEFTKHRGKADTLSLEQLLNLRNSGLWTDPDFYMKTPVLGTVYVADTAAVNRLFERYAAQFLPEDLKWMWTYKPYEIPGRFDTTDTVATCYQLIALRTVQGQPAITGQSIVSAKKEYEKNMGYALSLQFDDVGARGFSRATSHNIGRALAFVIGDRLYSYPTVNNQIDSGIVNIMGDFTEEEIDELIDFLHEKEQ